MKIDAFNEGLFATLADGEVVCRSGTVYGVGQRVLAAVVAWEEDGELVGHFLRVAAADSDSDDIHIIGLRLDQVAPSGKGLLYATNPNDSGLIAAHTDVFINWETGNVAVSSSPINPF